VSSIFQGTSLLIKISPVMSCGLLVDNINECARPDIFRSQQRVAMERRAKVACDKPFTSRIDMSIDKQAASKVPNQLRIELPPADVENYDQLAFQSISRAPRPASSVQEAGHNLASSTNHHEQCIGHDVDQKNGKKTPGGHEAGVW
jgi:hypothetical protein